MTTMKIKKGNQYKIQKIQNGGGNNVKQKLYELGGAGTHSKHEILSGTVPEYHRNKRFLQ